jgi:hypothetical protein
MLHNSNSLLLGLRERLADRFAAVQHPRRTTRRRQADPVALPFHMRLGLALFSSVALLASVTAGAAALYVFWVVSQDFSV